MYECKFNHQKMSFFGVILHRFSIASVFREVYGKKQEVDMDYKCDLWW